MPRYPLVHRTLLVALLTMALPALLPVAGVAKTFAVGFDDEQPGSAPRRFAPVVGVWVVARDGDNPVLRCDGSKWKKGRAAPELAESAKALFGPRAAAFAERVTAHADFPFALFPGVADFSRGEISLRFKALAGKTDQAAGIVFGVKENDDALILRANALEDNLNLYQFQDGSRSAIQEVSGAPTPSGTWHELKLVVDGMKVEGFLDGKRYLEHTLPGPVSGRIGVWSKSDSVVYFDDFTVTIPD